MKKNYPRKKLLFKLSAVLFTCLMLFVIHSCKKNFTGTDADPQISDPEVQQAKAWYDGAYPTAANSNIKTMSTGGEVDMTQIIKPNWAHTAKYKRFNKDVIEMPLNAESQVGFALANNPTSTAGPNKYTKTSYIVLKDGVDYKAYIMTIVADSAYINNDAGKLKSSAFNKRDANFSGYVFYFTPKGKYVSGWLYKNGKLVPPGTSTVATQQKVQSVGNQKLSTNSYPIYKD
jgi:hypothetical protein